MKVDDGSRRGFFTSSLVNRWASRYSSLTSYVLPLAQFFGDQKLTVADRLRSLAFMYGSPKTLVSAIYPR